jgi:hypothetical protein
VIISRMNYSNFSLETTDTIVPTPLTGVNASSVEFWRPTNIMAYQHQTKNSPQVVQCMTDRLTRYYILWEKSSRAIRHVADKDSIYNKSVEQWQSHPASPLLHPKRHDEKERAEYFAKCDAICDSQPTGPHEYVSNSNQYYLCLLTDEFLQVSSRLSLPRGLLYKISCTWPNKPQLCAKQRKMRK